MHLHAPESLPPRPAVAAVCFALFAATCLGQPPEAEPVPAGPPLTRAGALAEIDRAIDRAAAEEAFSGVVLVAKDGAPVLTRTVGLADRAAGAPVRPDTKFNLGSINKTFTRLAVFQLAEAGKLGLDDPLVKHLPDYPNREVAAKVTLRQLLDMQSGMGDHFGPRFDAMAKDRLRGPADYLPLFADQPLEFEPGARRRYSNAGYIVLGLVVERVSGESYYDYVRRHVFAPAGMTSTDSWALDEVVPNRAVGYTRGRLREEPSPGTPLRANVLMLPARGSSAGGGYSTAEDLLRFARALREGKLTGADHWRRNGGIGAAGGSPGVNAVLDDDWETGWTIVVLANLDPPAAESLARAVRGLLARVAESPRAIGC
jgi:CubicO group peptidase (beta-lactamase class C family)